MITDEMRAQMQAIQGNLAHSRSHSAGTQFLVDGQWVKKKPTIRANCSMFPYRSTSMAVDPSEVESVQADLRKKGLFTDFDESGRPIITSAKQQSDLAKAMGMKTGRDGYGHIDEHGNFQNSGRRRNDEVQEGRRKVRRVIDELEAMPETVHASVADQVFEKYDIRSTEENTG